MVCIVCYCQYGRSATMSCTLSTRAVALVRDIFFFKQKAAYEMRSSDWSSDVCSSDLLQRLVHVPDDVTALAQLAQGRLHPLAQLPDTRRVFGGEAQIGRASCRARVCQYV